jgi:hypothetical protein
VEVADQRHGRAHLRQPVADVRHGLGGLVAVDRDAHDLGAGTGKLGRLPRGASTSAVSVLVIDCTTMGASPPIADAADIDGNGDSARKEGAGHGLQHF